MRLVNFLSLVSARFGSRELPVALLPTVARRCEVGCFTRGIYGNGMRKKGEHATWRALGSHGSSDVLLWYGEGPK